MEEMVFSHTSVDSEILDRQKQKLAQDYKAIQGLASGYVELHMFNMRTDAYTPYYIEAEGFLGSDQIMFSTPNFFLSYINFVETYCHPDDREAMLRYGDMEYLEEALGRNKRVSHKFRIIKNGAEYWCEYIFIKFEPLFERPVEIAAGYIDIDRTEREEIKAREKMNRDMTIISTLSENYDSIYYISPDAESGEMVINETYRQNLTRVRHIPGWNDVTLFSERMILIAQYVCHPDDRDTFIEETDTKVIMEALKEHSDYSVNFRTFIDNRINYYRLLIVPVRDPKGDIQGLTVGVTSIDDTIQLAQAVEDARIAKKESEMKSRLVQNISHDIRTPLNAILGFAQLLCMPDGTLSEEEKEEFSGYVTDNGEMLLMLVDDVLNIADIEHGTIKISRMDVSLNEICRKAVQCGKLRAVGGVEVRFTSEVDDSFMINTDPKRVRQILINFLTNACKHTMEGEILVNCSTSEKEGFATISVTDTGDGVPAEMAEKIFRRFTALESNSESHGIGLSICRDIASRLDGNVYLDTEYRKGARFILSLPVKK